ncbi:hypothetical protein [Streptomyces sp. NPDC056817]|uniref:hypothetical protein n=1 Tax=Streptomyces sp. NPDC056817 TaxID=3345950 RepID=UPI0036CF52B2
MSPTVSRTVNVTIPSGTHTRRVDYVNWTGRATVVYPDGTESAPVGAHAFA